MTQKPLDITEPIVIDKTNCARMVSEMVYSGVLIRERTSE